MFSLPPGQWQVDFCHKVESVTNIIAILPQNQFHSRSREKFLDIEKKSLFHRLSLGNRWLVLTKVFHQKNSSPKRNTFQGQFQPRWLKFGKFTSDFYFSHHSSIIFLKHDGLCNSKGNEHSLEEHTLATQAPKLFISLFIHHRLDLML